MAPKAVRGASGWLASWMMSSCVVSNGTRCCRHLLDQRAIPILDRQITDHGAHDFDGFAFRVEFDEGCQAILGQEFLSHLGIVGAHAGTDDGPIPGMT